MKETAIQQNEKTILKWAFGKKDQLIKSVIPYNICFGS
jgi:hypothetical protein